MLLFCALRKTWPPGPARATGPVVIPAAPPTHVFDLHGTPLTEAVSAQLTPVAGLGSRRVVGLGLAEPQLH
jgi:hypothetical protein